MISPYGTAVRVASTTAAASGAGAASGSGYGTSSGAMRAMLEASHAISPPERSVRTSVSPSTRWLLTDIVRPVEKKTSSARAGVADARTAVPTAAVRNLFVMLGVAHSNRDTRGWAAPILADGLDEGVENPHAELAWVLVRRGVQKRRHERLVDLDSQLDEILRAELCSRDRDLLQDLLLRRQCEFLDQPIADADAHVLRFIEHRRRIVQIEKEDGILLRVLERQRRRLLRPLPFDERVVLRHFSRVPPLFELR